MPAFDPVRDAVLNSPSAPSYSLPATFPRSDFPPHLSPPNTTNGHTISPALASPSLTRRATDLSVLLNSDTQVPYTRTPPLSRSNTLSHLLHRESEDKLTASEPLRRSVTNNLTVDVNHDTTNPPSFQSLPPTSSSSRHSFPSPVHNTPSPIAGPSSGRLPPPDSPVSRSPFSFTSRPSSSSSASNPPQTLRSSSRPTSSSPAMPPPPLPSAIPYKPRKRVTPPGSVLIPLTQEEMEAHKHFRGKGTARLSKRKRATSSEPTDQPPAKKLAGDVRVIAEHYNTRPEIGVQQRGGSPIIGLKNFNNWVKSVLITRFAHPVLAASPRNSFSSGRGRSGIGKVLDMGCGKGGDITKWSKAKVGELYGVDIASVSVEQARQRWQTMRGSTFDATFAALDCYTEPLTKAFPPAKLAQPFDVVSMQFCMHYAFETVQKARCMLTNVSRWLRSGGVFIGTIPNAEQLIEHLDSIPSDAEDLSFGNSVYQVRFEERMQKPVFGHKYWFFLQDAVDNVPEYIVRWDNFVQMAAEFDLFPVYKEEFHHVFEEHREHAEFGPLMVRMKVVDSNGESAMDEDQWEAANMYIAFAFEKR